MSDADNIAGLGRALELAAIQITEYRETIDRLSTDLAAARAELAGMKAEATQTVLDSMRSALVRQQDAIATARQEAAAQGRAAAALLVEAEAERYRNIADVDDERLRTSRLGAANALGATAMEIRRMDALSSPPEPAVPAQPDAAARRAVAAYERFAAQEGDHDIAAGGMADPCAERVAAAETTAIEVCAQLVEGALAGVGSDCRSGICGHKEHKPWKLVAEIAARIRAVRARSTTGGKP